MVVDAIRTSLRIVAREQVNAELMKLQDLITMQVVVVGGGSYHMAPGASASASISFALACRLVLSEWARFLAISDSLLSSLKSPYQP